MPKYATEEERISKATASAEGIYRRRVERMKAARAAGTHTKEELEALLAEFDGRCVMCGLPGRRKAGPRSKWEPVWKDHINRRNREKRRVA